MPHLVFFRLQSQAPPSRLESFTHAQVYLGHHIRPSMPLTGVIKLKKCNEYNIECDWCLSICYMRNAIKSQIDNVSTKVSWFQKQIYIKWLQSCSLKDFSCEFRTFIKDDISTSSKQITLSKNQVYWRMDWETYLWEHGELEWAPHLTVRTLERCRLLR